MANFCPNCGAKLRAGVKFCGSCGQKLSVAQTTQQTINNQQTSAEGIVLKSSAPISDKRLSWAAMGYFACGCAMVVGLIVFAFARENDSDNAILLGAIILIGGLIGIFIVAQMDKDSVDNQLDEPRLMKFKFVHDVTADEIFNRLQPALKAVWGEQVTFDRRDEIISVTHGKTIYDIGLNDDGTFIVHWHKSLGNAIFSTDWTYSGMCRKIRTDTAVIAYELQRQFNVDD
ncbi:MAG: zinc ribbon domain-containing protein [Selenomonadaceae bacterium]|nr:zinc ribbon domain-containing protein [Selenomonadaceae bacterium]